jgi:hypothetical protein
LADPVPAAILTITNPKGFVVAVCWEWANAVRERIKVAARLARDGVVGFMAI